MRRPDLAILTTIATIAVFLIALCIFGQPVDAERIDVYGMHVRDRSLLTPEQQRVLVREGEVTVRINGEYVTFRNDESMRPYLNEGGIR